MRRAFDVPAGAARVRPDENAVDCLSFPDRRNAPEEGPDDVLAADGYIFAAPENLAALAGLMKDFFDRSYYPVLGQVLQEAADRCISPCVVSRILPRLPAGQ